MSTVIEYGNPDLWLVIFILAAGAVSNIFLSVEQITFRKMIGDLLRVVIVGIIIWVYGAMDNASVFKVVIVAGLSAVAWPHMINGFTELVKRNIGRFFDKMR
ncbi:hypothetical protein GW590_15300 [Rahnella sp. SAP-1]|jgi:hypothetical protein|uniref:Holin n=1 Tax=Rouxiella aceris TaxID=2703884 RepID=A0A848MIW8_9GAMM|nr:hypothetical protein [Rouxiella aceris]NMP28227.1 hypothetical protein [Rouxiella aceris]